MPQVKFIHEVTQLVTATVICLVLTCAANAQANAGKTARTNTSGPSRANTTPQTAELAEAEELGARVVTLYAEGKVDDALRLAKRVLEIREKALGPEHPLIDEALYNLAEIYIAKLNYKEAESNYQRLLTRFEKVYGPEDIKTAPMIEKLGYLSYRRGNLIQAESLLLRARAIFELKLGSGSEKVVSLTLDLAKLYRDKKDLPKAEATYLRALELSDLLKETPGRKTISLSSRAYDGYTCLIHETRSTNEANELEDRLIESRKKNREEKNGLAANEILNGRALVLPKPAYPAEARNERVEGTVKVRVNIDESGSVTLAWAVCGPPLLRNAAVIAASKARFSPTLITGKPVVANGVINYHFSFKW